MCGFCVPFSYFLELPLNVFCRALVEQIRVGASNGIGNQDRFFRLTIYTPFLGAGGTSFGTGECAA